MKLNYLKIGQRSIQGLCSLFLYWYVVTFLIDMRKKKVYGAVMYFSSICTMFIFSIIHLFIFLMYLNDYRISNHCYKKHGPADCVNLAVVNKYSILMSHRYQENIWEKSSTYI